MEESMVETLKNNLSVYCSASICRFKSNKNYYNSCNNPKILSEYSILVGGHAYVSGCKCKGCIKDDCDIKEHQVSNIGDRNEKTEFGNDSEILYICKKEN